MKNFFRLMMAAAVIFGAVSCTKSDVVEAVNGEEVKTTLTVSLADLGTRLAGDAAAIDKVEWGIYDEAGNFLAPHSSNGKPVDFANGQAEINVMLFVGKKYDLVFWAYNSGNTAYTVDWTARQLNVDYSAQKANVEANDAFFHIENGFIAGPSKTFTLKRPFAQLNAGQSMEDYNNMQKTDNLIDQSSLEAYAYTAMDLKTGEVVGSKTAVKLAMNDVIDIDGVAGNDHLVLASGEEYKHLAMNYLLVNERELIDVELTLHGNEGTNFVRPYYQVPVQRNYRTNILGSLISAPSVFTIEIDPIFDTNNVNENINVLHVFQHGGEVTLQKNLYVGHPLVVKKGVTATLNLNGHKIINYSYNEEPNTDVIIVEEGATLTINGDNNGNSEVRAVSGNSGYAVISEGTLIVNGGTFNSGKDAEGKANAVLYARGNGKIYVNGGEFPNKQNSGFVLNKKDADRATTVIEVTGGRFTGFNPGNNAAEGANTNFVAPGYIAVEESSNVWIVVEDIDFVDKGTYCEVYNAKGLLKWGYIAQFINKDYGVKLMNNITMPAKAIAEDAANETYVFTDEVITVTDGVPSASNWPAVSDYERSLNSVTNASEYFSGDVDGNGKTIYGLRINHDLVASGFICWTKDAAVNNLTFNDAVVYNKGGNLGESYTGIVIGRCWDGSHVANVNITNSSVTGYTEVGALVGRLYHRTEKANGQWLGEKMAYVTYCTTDEYTVVKGDENVGGIVGMNYGCVVGQCVNNADVTARKQAGGIAGAHQSYYKKADAFILACTTTAKATITATEKYAGAFAGYTRRDNSSHTNTRVWIVGCASESTVVAPNAGTMVGYCIKNNGVYGNCITACYAVTNGTEFAANGNPQIEASYNFASATDATQADVDAMNAAIEAFNVSPDNVYVNGNTGAEITKRWALVNGAPVLQ